ncbi:hypothetical protein F7734_55795 [Scytonema sp. UIC 10036]|uniref:hypothetical protein n=1 Tax=Scytonema sp. UIC 10036 TaxID=2304196 RepID=UPI0012DAA62E|nr:hypothetical protein [Scytonema sp. UIC 10036]MUH01044.1 hypothetical protein [Scytonema sp. UIC 10036]
MRNRYQREPEIKPLEPEAYTIAIYFFMFLLLVSFLGSSYLNRYPETTNAIQLMEEPTNDQR